MKIGFIGYGNMASAMVQGMIKSQRYAAEDITVTARNYEGLKTKAEKLKINFSTDNIQVASQSDILFLSVKPYLYKQIIEEIRDYVNVATVIVTVAADIHPGCGGIVRTGSQGCGPSPTRRPCRMTLYFPMSW